MLKTRILTAAVLFALFLAALFWLPLRYWAVLTTLVAVAAAWEWAGLAGISTRGRLVFAGIMLLACLWITHNAIIIRAAGGFWELSVTQSVLVFLWLPAAFFWCLVVPFWLKRRWPLNRNIRARGLFLLFLGFFLILATWSLLCYFPYGFSKGFLLWLLGIVWVSDISAYFAGRRFGGKKLAPQISPGKTWAGVYGALAGVLLYWAATITCLMMAGDSRNMLMEAVTQHPLALLPLMLFLAVIGILGDLFESLLKRQANIKDSGNLLPGHGGVLDRVDSLMAVLPCAALLYVAILTYLSWINTI
jgi:phosphatidate cytidylyltransferase